MTENPHGTLSEEALKLAETLQTWLTTGAAMTGVGSASECKVCPVCQAIAMVNGLKPEVLGHLTEAGTQLLAALRAATDRAATDRAATDRAATDRAATDGAGTDGPAAGAAANAATHAATTEAERSWAASDRPPVQHITVT